MSVWERLIQYVQMCDFTRLMTEEEIVPDTDPGAEAVYFRQDAGGCYLVFLLREPEAAGWDQEDYLEWRRCIESEVFRRVQRVPVCLGILCVEYASVYRDWCSERQIWLVEEGSGRVIRYENQTMDFLGWERSLEEALVQEPAGRKREAGTARSLYRHFPVITVILLLINIGIFVLLELLLPTETSLQLFSDGAMYWPAVQEAGQYYRLITSMFLHFDSAHLMNNMLILFLIGSRLEDLVGKTRFAVVYFIAGILAGLTSMGYNILQNRPVIAAGASGAVFGIIGGLVWVVIAHRGRVQGLTGRQMLLFAALSLYGGFANQQTDNAAHLGGLLAGFLLMMLLYRRKPAGAGMERR